MFSVFAVLLYCCRIKKMYLVRGTEHDRPPNHEHTHFRLYDVECKYL